MPPVAQASSYKSKMSQQKPKLSSKQLVQKMIDKGISINQYSETDIESYLLNSNNFLRLFSYRKLYQKHTSGENKGKYINLDFDQLKALAILDMKMRKNILSMCIDIEHSVKIRLLSDFEKSADDGYKIVQDFFNTESGEKVAQNIVQKHNNVYINGLAKKYIYEKEDDSPIFTATYFDYNTHRDIDYNLDLPIWSMLEMVTFGDLLHFYEFYYDKEIHAESPQIPVPHKILMNVKNIRNACAHNNCILTNLSDNSVNIKPCIKKFISELNLGFGNDSITKKLKCKVINEIVCVFYSLNILSSKNVAVYDFEYLSDQMEKYEHKYLKLFSGNELILTSFNFLKKTVDKLK